MRFFDQLSASFIASDNCNDIDKAFEESCHAVQWMEKKFEKLRYEAVMVRDDEAIKQGRSMLQRVQEVKEKLREFSEATLLSSKSFKKQVDTGKLVW